MGSSLCSLDWHCNGGWAGGPRAPSTAQPACLHALCMQMMQSMPWPLPTAVLPARGGSAALTCVMTTQQSKGRRSTRLSSSLCTRGQGGAGSHWHLAF